MAADQGRPVDPQQASSCRSGWKARWTATSIQALAILEDLITERGMFQVVIHFSSSRATGWFIDDPFRYRILDHEALADPDVCLLYPPQPWPAMR